jgi:NDP-sugar pyrophosphorylase family protein
MDAVVVAGGRGTRLAGLVHDVPKPLAPVGGRPFLDYLLMELASGGLIESVVLALGHLAQPVIDYYRATPSPLPLQFVVETEPLGTAGAIRNALRGTVGDVVVACNGDTLVHVDLRSLMELHAKSGAEAALALVAVDDMRSYGRVYLEGHYVTGFLEKMSDGPGLASAGVYVFSRRMFDGFPADQLSMERDVLPRLAAQGQLVGLEVPGPLLDIGLPETYAAAADFVQQFERTIRAQAGLLAAGDY